MKAVSYRFILLLCLQAFVITLAQGQNGTVKGKVSDRNTSQPLPYASIYINSSTMGTFSDDHGVFNLKNIPPGDYDLIVSYIGHESYQARIRVEADGVIDLNIKLALSTLKEIQITGKRDDKWAKQLEKFKRLFLGTGDAAKLCQLINPWSLRFEEKKDGTFSAVASDIIEVENMALGYRVSYQLNELTVTKDKYFISGFIRFRELETTDSTVAKRWVANRMKAYEGSTRHFFKSAIENQLTQDQFVLYEDRSELKQIVRNSRFLPNVDKTIFLYPMEGKVRAFMDSTLFTIQMPTRLEVHYKNDNTHSKIYWDVPHPVSWMEVQGGVLNLTKDGIVLNPIKMTLSGNMFDQRISDALPNDYKPEKRTLKVLTDSTQQKPTSALTYLTEKPYLHTDKAYYYANEVVWFKVYMNYVTPALSDSLSRVLFVDLLNKKGEAVSQSIFHIEKGYGSGNITVPSFAQSGDYTLRAYTRWMLNFGSDFIFTKPIKILDMGELVRAKNESMPDPVMDHVVITSEKEVYDPREKITLQVEVRDDLDQIVPANLSVSVTDLTQAVPAGNETTILSDYYMPDVSVPDTLDKTNRHLIQNGIDVKGKFIFPKGKTGLGVLTLIQDNADMAMTFTTKEDGSFFLPNLMLYDSAKLSIGSKKIKGKAGKVILDTLKLHVPLRLSNPLQVDVYKTENPTRHFIPDYTKAQLLESVTVKATRIESRRSSVIPADYSITGEWMEERHVVDVLTGIRLKVPGMRVIISVDQDGFLSKRIVMTGAASFDGNSEPLVIIDDVPVNGLPGAGNNAVAQIEALNPSQIESVEVVKFGNGAAYGARGSSGVIKIYTKRGSVDQANIRVDLYDKSTVVPVSIAGFSEMLKFTSPDYSSLKSSDIPDNRSTLYWNPTLKTDGKNPSTATFFAADVPTTYRIVVEGLTAAGKPVRSEKRITIKKLP